VAQPAERHRVWKAATVEQHVEQLVRERGLVEVFDQADLAATHWVGQVPAFGAGVSGQPGNELKVGFRPQTDELVVQSDQGR
jgi:hypothetical protein